MKNTPSENATPMMKTPLDDGLHNLLAAWTTHDDLRRHGAPIAELAASNERLFSSRLAVRSLPRAA